MSDVLFSRASMAAAELPVYPGMTIANVNLVTSGELAAQACDALVAAETIGFDTESKPTFLKGEVSTGPHLVQLATATKAYLFPISEVATHAVLKFILESPQILKVGFGLGNDRRALQSRLDIGLNNVLDLGEVLRGPGHRGTVGAKVAVAHYFNQKFQKSKKVGTSNWANAFLNERQLLYAANDAHVALRIYQAWLSEQGPKESALATPV